MLNGTRGRSYTNFPRNTRVRHIQTCAEQVREAERIKQEMEACYGEWEPTQVHHCAEMVKAQDTAEWVEVCELDAAEQGISWNESWEHYFDAALQRAKRAVLAS